MTKQTPWLRVFVEGVVIVGSILLAFGIQAWWDDRQEREEEGRILAGLLQESRTNTAWIARMLPYHQAKAEAVSVLLEAAAEEAPNIGADSIDHVLIDLSGWYITPYERGVLDATLLGGKLDLIENEGLRSRLAAWQRRLADAEARVSAEEVFVLEVWLPFLRENASVPQISNAQTEVAVGLNLGDSYATHTPVRGTVDHTSLLRIREFVNILQEAKWVHEDALNNYSTIGQRLDELIRALEDEVGVGADTS